MNKPASTINVLIATYLEPEHVEQIRRLSPRLNVLYEPSLLPPPRYPADHTNVVARAREDEQRWRELLGQAEVLFDFDHTHRDELPELAPRVRWIQATSAGIGQFVRRYGYATRMPHTIFTTASGVHAQPLAEFCALVMLSFSRNLERIRADQQARRWERYAAGDLQGRELVIVGAGTIGSAVARVARALGMRVVGVKRSVGERDDPATLYCDELYPVSQLSGVLPRAEFLVLITPHTDQTERLIGAAELALLPRGAVLINIGRGACLDQAALVDALQRGQLGGAALDVFEHEPLAADSPLWSLPNVIISPHSASTSDRENERITDLFCDNMRRFLDGQPLRNVLDVDALY